MMIPNRGIILNDDNRASVLKSDSTDLSNSTMALLSGIDQIIISVTRKCPYSCIMCSMNSSSGAPVGRKLGNTYLENLAFLALNCPSATFDVSGGDPLLPGAIHNTLKVLETIGPDRCSVSTTGAFTSKHLLQDLKGIATFDFTIDVGPDSQIKDIRPVGYSKSNLSAIKLCRNADFNVSCCTVLTSLTCRYSNLRSIQRALHELDIKNWTLLPLYKAGRANGLKNDLFNIPSLHDILARLSSDSPTPKLQHTMRNGSSCQAGIKTLYISPEGKIASCPWALDAHGFPLDDFVSSDMNTVGLHNLGSQIRKGKCPMERKCFH